jgi:hypothetical protein
MSDYRGKADADTDIAECLLLTQSGSRAPNFAVLRGAVRKLVWLDATNEPGLATFGLIRSCSRAHASLSKLFEYFCETVGNRFYKYRIILRL